MRVLNSKCLYLCMAKNDIEISDYNKWILDIKLKVHRARTQIALSVNAAVLELYWEIGKGICKKQSESNWGQK